MEAPGVDLPEQVDKRGIQTDKVFPVANKGIPSGMLDIMSSYFRATTAYSSTHENLDSMYWHVQ